MKEIQIISDLHCGSSVGLSPFPTNPVQKELLECYTDCIAHFGERPDILIVNGDAVDGLMLRGRAKEDETWIPKQINHAVNLIKMWKPKEVILVSGTPYHTVAGSGRVDFEELVAMQLRETIPCLYTMKLKLRVNGWFKLRCRHKIGSSGVPYGRATAPKKSMLWAFLEAALRRRIPNHLSVFSHVHYWEHMANAFGAAITTPGWQAQGGEYGEKACDGHVDVGGIRLRVGETENEGWKHEERLYPSEVVEVLVDR